MKALFFGMLLGLLASFNVQADFFGGDDMCIKIKSLKNEGELDVIISIFEKEKVVIVDVELAAKPYDADRCDY